MNCRSRIIKSTKNKSVACVGTSPFQHFTSCDAQIQTTTTCHRQTQTKSRKYNDFQDENDLKSIAQLITDDILPQRSICALQNISSRMMQELSRKNHSAAFTKMEISRRDKLYHIESNSVQINSRHKYSLSLVNYRKLKQSWNKEHKFRDPLESSKTIVTGLSWSSNWKMLAVTYSTSNKPFQNQNSTSQDKIPISCDAYGTIVLWDNSSSQISPFLTVRDKEMEPIRIVEYESSLLCIAAHPKNPYLFATGSSNGKVVLFDLSLNNDESKKIVICSSISSYFHQEPVRSICWKYDSNWNEWLLATAGTDGKVLFWNSSSKLKCPCSGFCLKSMNCNKSVKLDQSNKTPNLLIRATSLIMPSLKTHYEDIFYVGSEGGNIMKINCGRNLKLAIRELKNLINMKWSTNALAAISQVDEKLRKEIIGMIEKKAELKRKRGVDIDMVYEARVPLQLLYSTSTEFLYKAHTGSIANIDVNPFDNNILVSCAADGEVRLYSVLHHDPICIFEPALRSPCSSRKSFSSLLDVKFSKTKQTVSLFERL